MFFVQFYIKSMKILYIQTKATAKMVIACKNQDFSAYVLMYKLFVTKSAPLHGKAGERGLIPFR